MKINNTVYLTFILSTGLWSFVTQSAEGDGAVFNYSPNDVPGSGYARVGYGINPETNQVMSVTNYDEAAFIGDDSDKLVLIVEASQRREFTKFGADALSTIKAKKSSYAGGMGLHYGLLSSQAKAAYSEAHKSSKGEINIVQQSGLMGFYRQSFPFDPAKEAHINSDARRETAQAMMNGMPLIAKKINQIRSSYGPARDMLIKDFLLNHGTHAITSVVRGYYAQYKSIFKHNIADDSKGSGFKSSITAKGWGASLSNENSLENSQSLLKNAWSFDSEKEVFPDSTALNEQVNALQKELNVQMAQANGFYDLAAAMKAQTVIETLEKMPEIKDTAITPSSNFIKERNENKKKVSEAKGTIDDMTLEMGIVSSLVEKYGNAATTEKEYKKAIERVDKGLEKFVAGGAYFDLDLPDEYDGRLAKVKRERNYLKITPEIEPKKLKEIADIDSSSSQVVEKDQGDFVFQTWLKDKLKPLGKHFEDLSQSELAEYKDQWQEETKLKGSNGSQLLLSTRQSGPLNSASSQPDYVVMDMNIVPWAMIFPELGGIGIPSYENMAFSNILSQIQTLQDMFNYLNLCISYDGKLDATGTSSAATFNQQLTELSLSIADILSEDEVNMQVSFNGADFDLGTSSGFIQLEGTLNGYELEFQNRSTPLIKTWLGIYHKLNGRDLLKPTGNISYLLNPDYNKETSISKPEQYVLLGYQEEQGEIIGVEPSNQELGTVVRIMASLDPAYPINTLLPIITSETYILKTDKKERVAKLKFNQYYGVKQQLTQKVDAPIGSGECLLDLEEKIGLGTALRECSFYPQFAKYKSGEADNLTDISDNILRVSIGNDDARRPYGALVLVPMDQGMMNKITEFNQATKSVQLPLFFGMGNVTGSINASLSQSFNH